MILDYVNKGFTFKLLRGRIDVSENNKATFVGLRNENTESLNSNNNKVGR